MATLVRIIAYLVAPWSSVDGRYGDLSTEPIVYTATIGIASLVRAPKPAREHQQLRCYLRQAYMRRSHGLVRAYTYAVTLPALGGSQAHAPVRFWAPPPA